MKSVTILGSAPHEKLARGEVWIANFEPEQGVKYTRSFQLHPYLGRNADEDLWLEECDVPIYTIRDEKALNPNSVVYPIEEVMSMGGPLCSSFDYMMALAILENFRVIHLDGIALQAGSPRERLLEHVSLSYWIGYARAKGKTVVTHGKKLLYFPYRYGYDYQQERTFGQRMALWAFLGMSGEFDDGAAKGPAQGWVRHFDADKIVVSI